MSAGSGFPKVYPGSWQVPILLATYARKHGSLVVNKYTVLHHPRPAHCDLLLIINY